MQNKRKNINTIRSRSVEYSQFGMFRVISRAIYIFSACILVASFWFLYTRMYHTIGQVESLVAISLFAKIQVLDISSYDTVQAIIKQKELQERPVLLRDPFNNVANVTTSLEPVLSISTSTISTDDDSFNQNL